MSDFSIQPINQSPVPIGSIPELEADNLDPTVYASCSRPNPVTGIVGCPFYSTCMVSAKGKDGPRNYGVQIFKGPGQGGGMTTMSASCMWLAQHARVYERNDGSVRVIANEGETFDKVTRIAINNQTNEVAGKYDRDVRREDRRIKVKVQPYPRPSENAELLTDMLRAEMAQTEKERRTGENLARNLGLSETIAPIDKRDAGRHGGGKAKG